MNSHAFPVITYLYTGNSRFIHMSVYIQVSVYPTLDISICRYIPLSIYPHVGISHCRLSTCRYIPLSIYPHIGISHSRYIHVSVNPTLDISTCRYIPLSIYPDIVYPTLDISTCRYIPLSIYRVYFISLYLYYFDISACDVLYQFQ